MASSIRAPRRLRYCIHCVNEDIKNYGEPYWHRTHQVPGVEVCPIHHKSLSHSTAEATSRFNKFEFVALDESRFAKKALDSEEEPDVNPALQFIAKSVHSLLNQSYPIVGPNELKVRYIEKLKQRNLTTVMNASIRQRDFLQAFRQFYGDTLLAKLGCKINASEQDSWLSKLVRHPRAVAHPLKHILLMNFLGGDLDIFFTEEERYQPFGKGPWLCLNPAADHYKQPVIRELTISRDYETGSPMGKFSCACGFVFCRRGPDKSDQDQFRIGNIKRFGHVWEEKLLHLINIDGLSMYGTSRILQCDPTTAKKHLMRLRNNVVEDTVEEKQSLQQRLFEREKHRNVWLKAAIEHPYCSKTELRKRYYATFMWLYRYDRDWLNSNSPALLPRRKYSDTRVDWGERDKEISAQVEVVIRTELACETKPVRLCVSYIGKKIGHLTLLQRHIDKLPETKALIDKYCESIEDFQIRRVKYVGAILRQKQIRVMKWEVVLAAGLRPGYSERVNEQINIELLIS